MNLTVNDEVPAKLLCRKLIR